MRAWATRLGCLWLLALACGVRAATATNGFAVRLAAMESAAAAQPTNAAIRFEIGRLLHWEGSLGRKHVGEPAVRWLRECLRLQPTNAFARALVGSALTLQARDASLPTTRLRLVRAGLAEMDAAVREAPADANVRFTRACNNLFLPALFKREAVVKSDFEWLDQQLKGRSGELGVEFCQWTRCYQGIALRKAGDPAAAERLWTEALRLDPRSEAAARIRKECRCEAP